MLFLFALAGLFSRVCCATYNNMLVWTAAAAAAAACYLFVTKANEVIDRCERQPTLREANQCLVDQFIGHSEAQMSSEQYLYISDRISGGLCRARCNVLVFGVGGDSSLWISANRDGRTVFIEEDETWAERARQRSPSIKVYTYTYRTTLARLDEEINDVDAQFYDFLPPALASLQWNVILIDAPTGYVVTSPGRLQPVWFAAKHAASITTEQGRDIDIFLHDANRHAEQRMGREFFSFPFQTHPLLISSPNREQTLAHWKLRSDRNSFVQQLARAPGQHGFVVMSLLTKHANNTEQRCAEEMHRHNVASVQAAGIAPKDIVFVGINSDNDGVTAVPAGNYFSEQFAAASLLKTRAVLAAMRFGFAVLLLDIDTLLISENFDAALLKPRGRQSFVFQQELESECKFSLNSGAYLAQPCSQSARLLGSVIETAKQKRVTEQNAWLMLLADTYNPLIESLCRNDSTLDFTFTDDRYSLAFLSGKQYINGYWLQRLTKSQVMNTAHLVHFNFVVGACTKLSWMKYWMSQEV